VVAGASGRTSAGVEPEPTTLSIARFVVNVIVAAMPARPVAARIHQPTPAGDFDNATASKPSAAPPTSGRTVRAEALLRWLHPDLGALGPAEFIPVAESNGSIHRLGAWMLRQALLRMRDIRTLGIDDFRICVNRSPVEIRNWDGDAELRVLQLLQEFDLPGTALVLEITEGIMLEADPAVKRHLEDLRAHGIQLALDDFGTGYSSISHLHNHDLDLIKIDRQFVRMLQPESREMILCRSIIRMAHDLGLKVVAEGIETEQQHAILLELGCDYGQGFWLGRPMPAKQLLNRLLREQIGTASE